MTVHKLTTSGNPNPSVLTNYEQLRSCNSPIVSNQLQRNNSVFSTSLLQNNCPPNTSATQPVLNTTPAHRSHNTFWNEETHTGDMALNLTTSTNLPVNMTTQRTSSTNRISMGVQCGSPTYHPQNNTSAIPLHISQQDNVHPDNPMQFNLDETAAPLANSPTNK